MFGIPFVLNLTIDIFCFNVGFNWNVSLANCEYILSYVCNYILSYICYD